MSKTTQYDEQRDCPHGHMKGKCDTCELIEAEKTVTDNSAVIRALEKRGEELEAQLKAERAAVWKLIDESRQQQARIAELEAACEKAEYELDWHSDELRKLEAEEQLFNKTFDAQQLIIEELRAENQRLRNSLADIALKLAGMLRGVK